MDIGIIAAISDNGVIGKDGRLPWHIPEDFKHFKKLTFGNSVIMGRKTYNSIGKPLVGRENIVLTRGNIEGVRTAKSLTEALIIAEHGNYMRTYIIGGHSVYKDALSVANFMEITEVHQEVDGDVYFPKFNWNYWREVTREYKDNHSFVSYIRK